MAKTSRKKEPPLGKSDQKLSNVQGESIKTLKISRGGGIDGAEKPKISPYHPKKGILEDTSELKESR